MALTDEQSATLAELLAMRDADGEGTPTAIVIEPPSTEQIGAQADATVKIIEASADAEVKLIEARADADEKVIEAAAEAAEETAPEPDGSDDGPTPTPEQDHWYFRDLFGRRNK